MPAPDIPEKIGKYKVQHLLGKGAMGLVYRAFDSDIERTVAIKTLHPHLIEGEQGIDFEQRFIQEAKAAARCLHPNIVAVFDFGVNDASPYIVMEYVEGDELKQKLQNKEFFTFNSSIEIIIQILEALNYSHEKGVVHRDIKPANIMLMKNGKVKVSDFGVARLDNSDLTSTGMMVGTPNYMSPEGMHGLKVDQRSDLFSVGILLFELLTSQRPYTGLSLLEAISPLDKTDKLDKTQVEQITPIILKALQPKPDTRYQFASEFLFDLKNILAGTNNDQGTVIYQANSNPPSNNNNSHTSATATDKSDLNVQAIHSDVLAKLEASLVKYIGPTARILVKKLSKKSSSIHDLSISLSEKIPNEAERSEFLRSLESTGVRAALASQTAINNDLSRSGIEQASSHETLIKPEQALSLSSDKLDSIAEQLTFFVGPLAKRLVSKAYKKSSNIDEFYRKLSSYIPDSAEQTDFLTKVKKS